MQPSEFKKQIVKAIESLGLRHGHEAAFRDWCEIMALAIQNGCDLIHGEKWEAREQRYLDIMAKYEENEKPLFPQMFVHLANMLECEPFQDALGQIYMELFANQTKNKTLGQCFTPIHVSYAAAKMSIGADVHRFDEYSITNPLKLNDCAVGGGAMIIGALHALHELGFDWQHKCKATCNDLDRLCVHMCYVQLSLIGARAIVLHQDTMTQQVFETFVSPMELLWPATLDYEMPHKAPETPQIDPEPPQPIQTPIELPKREIKQSGEIKQLSLF